MAYNDFFCVCLINAPILKWYGRDFVVYASNLILQSCKLYFTTKFVKIITVYCLSVIENSFLALLHMPFHMITVRDVRSDLFKC